MELKAITREELEREGPDLIANYHRHMNAPEPSLLEINGTFDEQIWSKERLHECVNPTEVWVSITGDNYETDEQETSKKISMPANVGVREILAGRMHGYIKQQQIEWVAPSLGAHFPKFCDGWAWTQQRVIWVGSPGCVTGLHRDPWCSVLIQLEGSKLVHLLPPWCSYALYDNLDLYDTASINSKIEVMKALKDPSEFPMWEQVKHYRRTAVLKKGHALVIPKNWYHQVHTLETSISINVFGGDFLDWLYRDRLWRLEVWMHYNGWYRRDRCVCHLSKDAQAKQKKKLDENGNTKPKKLS